MYHAPWKQNISIFISLSIVNHNEPNYMANIFFWPIICRIGCGPGIVHSAPDIWVQQELVGCQRMVTFFFTIIETKCLVMMTSSNGNMFRVTGLWGHWWIPLTKASDTKLWCFLWSARLRKHSRRWWFEMPSRALWRHWNWSLSLLILISWDTWYGVVAITQHKALLPIHLPIRPYNKMTGFIITQTHGRKCWLTLSQLNPRPHKGIHCLN